MHKFIIIIQLFYDQVIYSHSLKFKRNKRPFLKCPPPVLQPRLPSYGKTILSCVNVFLQRHFMNLLVKRKQVADYSHSLVLLLGLLNKIAQRLVHIANEMISCVSDTQDSILSVCCCSVTKLCPILFDFMDCSMAAFLVLPYLLGFAQIHVH